MPLRSPKMYSFIFGFQRRTWWPKWTPASKSSFIVNETKLSSPSRELVLYSPRPYALSLEGHQPEPRQWNQVIADFQLPIAQFPISINADNHSDNWQWAIGNDLPLRELEALSRAL